MNYTTIVFFSHQIFRILPSSKFGFSQKDKKSKQQKRQKDKKTKGQKGKGTERQKYKKTRRQRDKKAKRQKYKETKRQKKQKTKRQKKTKRHKMEGQFRPLAMFLHGVGLPLCCIQPFAPKNGQSFSNIGNH